MTLACKWVDDLWCMLGQVVSTAGCYDQGSDTVDVSTAGQVGHGAVYLRAIFPAGHCTWCVKQFVRRVKGCQALSLKCSTQAKSTGELFGI